MVEWREVASEVNEYIYEKTVESYCVLEKEDMDVWRSEDYFEPWGGKVTRKENLDYETTDDGCENVEMIWKK